MILQKYEEEKSNPTQVQLPEEETAEPGNREPTVFRRNLFRGQVDTRLMTYMNPMKSMCGAKHA